ncbi:hypothetical protein [Endozoicomonas sp. OPT23]|uniref:hypothetical protein n=1 Tax=Endozoicomonas sp. OPT23 TaxID=2072845 RepID=UPI00129B1C94|nr:hypothetical protein [Endozoicomonas sp. OPT23]
MNFFKPSLLIILASMNLSVFATDDWSDDNWEEDWGTEETPSQWQWSGFLEAGYGSRLQSDSAIGRDKTLSEIRARVELEYQVDNWRFDLEVDGLYDDLLHKSEIQTRVASISFSPLNNMDIKAGRQVLTWGTGDYLFLNDLFAKDWQSYFSGRDDEYLKASSNSIKTSWFADSFSVDLVWTPRFTPDHTLNGDRFSYFSPATGQSSAVHLNPDEPAGSSWSGRLSTNHNSVEYSLYGYMGYWTTPLGIKANGRMTYPELNVWGASLRMPVGNGLFNSEIAWYDSREDRSGDNPQTANSQVRWLAGYEQEIGINLTAAVQYYLEWTQDYDQLKSNSATPDFEQDEYRQLLTMRLTKLTHQQKLTWSLFSFWSWTDKDTYLKPSVSWRINDQWTVATGANLFYGRQKHSFFGQHKDNSNAWLRVRWNY